MDVVDLRAIRKAVEGEVPEVVRIARRDVHQEVVSAGDVEDTSHLGELDHVGPERVDQIPRVLPKANCDQRFETDADRRRFDVGVVSTNHTQSRETTHSFQTGRRRHANSLGESIVGHASILLQNVHNGEVNSVELVGELHYQNNIRLLEKHKNLLLQFPLNENNHQYRDLISELTTHTVPT
jgi:hypothetical protein